MKKTKNFYSIAITFCIIIFATLIIAVGMLTRPNTSSSTKLNEPIKLKDNWYNSIFKNLEIEVKSNIKIIEKGNLNGGIYHE